jgi:hypothetical protein
VATLITPAQLRDHVETDLVDAALQRIIDDADAAIIRRFGDHTANIVETRTGGGRLIFLDRPALSISSISEHLGMPFEEDTTVLAVDDYRLWYGGHAIERLASGTNARTTWGDRVVVTYAPIQEIARRTRVEIDLCKLAIQHDATRQTTAGDYSQTNPNDYQAARERILDELAPALAFS